MIDVASETRQTLLDQTAELTADERKRVMSGNAVKLFPRLGR